MILLLCIAMLLGGQAAAGTATFRVHDHLDPHEIEENTSLYIDARWSARSTSTQRTETKQSW